MLRTLLYRFSLVSSISLTRHAISFAYLYRKRNNQYFVFLPSLTLPFASKQTDEKNIIKADQLFNDNKFDELIILLKSIPSWNTNSELLWRVSRCQYQILKNNKNASIQEQEKILTDSLELVQKCLELDQTCGPGYKWAAILLDELSSLKGIRKRIEHLFNIKDYMEKAIKYSPEDATSYYILGLWHYSCWSVSWVERNIAKVIFGELPQPDLEIALNLVEKAEEIDPGFYSKNKVLIAQILFALNRDLDRVRKYAEEILRNYKSSKKWDDIEAVKEAETILKKLPKK